MPFAPDTVKYLAHLARIEIDDTRDGASIQEDLDRIVSMVDKITLANTEGIAPMAHPLDAHQPLRTDEVTEQNERESLLTLAPQSEAGLYLVPLIIEGS
jgi:aspartyl-tRNA(Asn)/glutamyl-tRNA(Gln) amidotransferase subunit C